MIPADELHDVYYHISDERDRQELLKAQGRFQHTCADQELSDLACLAVLMEEVGEVARSVLEAERLTAERLTADVQLNCLYTELVQVAAVCVAWLEKLVQRQKVLEQDQHGRDGQ